MLSALQVRKPPPKVPPPVKQILVIFAGAVLFGGLGAALDYFVGPGFAGGSNERSFALFGVLAGGWIGYEANLKM